MGKADKRARKRQNQQQARIEREAAAKRAGRMRQIRFGGIGLAIIVIVVAIVAVTGGNNNKKKKTPVASGPTCVNTTPAKSGNAKQYKTAPAMTIDPKKTYSATFETSCGTFTAALDAKDSPKGVNNFVFLARQGFYNGLKWHRVVADFVIQGGDPTGSGSGGPGYSVVTESPKQPFKTGDLAWAKSGNEAPGTAGSQFFVTTGDPAALNSTKKGTTYDYGYFGHVTSGITIAKKLESFAVASDQNGAPSRPLYMFKVTITEK